MPRVVPSQVVRFIASISLREFNGVVSMNEVGPARLSAVLDLVDQTADELLAMDNDTYTSFIHAEAQIKEILATWTSNRNAGFQLQTFQMNSSQNPLARIHDALAKEGRHGSRWLRDRSSPTVGFAEPSSGNLPGSRLCPSRKPHSPTAAFVRSRGVDPPSLCRNRSPSRNHQTGYCDGSQARQNIPQPDSSWPRSTPRPKMRSRHSACECRSARSRR
jgi:hypothetical protein